MTVDSLNTSNRRPRNLAWLVSRAKQESFLIRDKQQDVAITFGVAATMNATLWLMRQFWFPFNPSIAWYGFLILALNLGLSLMFARKAHVFAQALSVTAVVAELLLIILIIRTGAASLI